MIQSVGQPVSVSDKVNVTVSDKSSVEAHDTVGETVSICQ